MNTDIYLEPETDEEVRFLELLAEAREYGNRDAGLSDREIARVFNQFAIGTLNMEDRIAEDIESETVYTCPICGDEIEDLDAPGIGMDPTVQPCGHQPDYSDLPPELVLDSEE